MVAVTARRADHIDAGIATAAQRVATSAITQRAAAASAATTSAATPTTRCGITRADRPTGTATAGPSVASRAHRVPTAQP